MITMQAVRTPARPLLPPELLGSIPREVRLTSGGVVVAMIATAFVIAALVSALIMSAAYARSESERRLRQREGVATDAEVVDVAVTRGDQPRRVVTYRYEVGGRVYTPAVRLRGGDRRDLKSGMPIRIGFLQSRPQTSWLAGNEPRNFPVWLIPLVALFLLLVALAVARSIRRQWILLSEGRAAEARVVSTKRVRRDHHTGFRVSYEFQTLSGAKQTSRCDVGKKPPAVGTTLPIVYHRDKPAWSAAYPLELVRPRRLGADRLPHR